MDSYVKVCHRPITIGVQKFAYQCEPIVFSAAHGETIIRGFIPSNKGKELYPNQEADRIKHYELKIRSFTGNAIELHFTKVFKDQTIEWEQFRGKIDRNNGVLEPGDPYKVEGRCKDCGNNWTFRGVYQIDKLFKES